MANVCALLVTAIEAEARAAGLLGARQPLSQCRALRDARLMLKLQVVREGFGADGRWVWTRKLPKPIQETPPTPPAQPKKPKKNRKERKKEFRAKKVARRRLKAAERRARREAARALKSMAQTSSMEGTSSMEEASSMAETSSLASADAPALAPGQQADNGGDE
jgi:hypothetical protein